MKLFVHLASCLIFFSVKIVTGLDIRLWPVNARGNEGFVEVYHAGSWGLIGSPAFRFSDATASLLCKTLGLSDLGYSSGWTSIDNYGGYIWTYGLECNGNETSIDQCNRPGKWERYNYSNTSSWEYRHGTRLFCVDSRIKGGLMRNTGIVETSFDGKTYALCYDGIDMNAANVVCNHLGYDGALSIEKGAADTTPLYDMKLACKGCEYSLTECDRSTSLNSKCLYAAVVTCKAVRIARMSRYIDEGPVEVFNEGSWGFVGNPGFSFDNETASYLCRRFGLSDVGFSTSSHSLQTYGRKAWLSRLTCKGDEADIMQCSHPNFSTVPILMHTYKWGTWLYCFSNSQNEGRVELLINGRWGSISSYYSRSYNIENAAKVLCKEMGYSGLDMVMYNGNIGRSDDLFWMSEVSCNGKEDSVMKCRFIKGPRPMTYVHPVYLKIRCSG
ncbi:scavenger receptor cysteine-rich type 1 protein M130-like isoform X2 [Mercenaria mercenaria]|uniref:scavenger receptor cysteine-rich type 1 protein M130-like isoform X2 n=1 Tax=Mercenaria mercenaria TaxID=6596 RepID=UPI00234F51EA|nr:scavenger receptor cysteine-rich type 1 protein M130-like isoform X2 [Mercenaria mercenaria]